ncbi:MAG TPA: hypothetical protein ENH82_07565, partial [bacterium]|nr:hypothetical protein [bacterium]
MLRPGDNPPNYRVTAAAQVLNVMILGWQAQNIGLWLNTQLCLFLNKANTEFYNIGPSGDHCTATPFDTTTSVAAEEDDLTITVSDATNIST